MSKSFVKGSIVILLVALGASILLRGYDRDGSRAIPEILELRRIAERQHAEYVELRDEYEEQRATGEKAAAGNPEKLAELGKDLWPLRKRVDDLENGYRETCRKIENLSEK